MQNKSLRSEVLSFALIYLLLCVFVAAFSPAPQLYVGHDLAPVIDGAWRLENHQVPHRDFSSVLGHGYLLQQKLFLHLFHYNFIAFAISSIAITTLVFLAFLSFYRSEKFVKNTSRLLRVYLFLLLVCLGLGQYHFGVGHTLLTYANLYNRYCFLCLLVMFIQILLFKDVKTINAGVVLRLFVTGLLLNYLLFVKLTYFVVAVGLLTAGLFLALVTTAIYVRLLLVSLFIFICVSLIIKADFLAMLQDYQTISAARGKVLLQASFLRYKLLQHYNLLFLGSLFLLVAELFFKKLPLRFLLLIGVVGICSVLLHFTNWGATDIVMLAFIPVVFILFPGYTKLLSFKLFMAMCCFFLFKNLRSIYYLSKVDKQDYTELKSPFLSRFYTSFTEVECKEDYAAKVMSGVGLINKNKKAGERVFSFSFDNPFPFLTRTVPPKHLPTVWQYATTYTYAVYTPPDKLFSEVELLLVPRCLKAESATEMMTLYNRTVKAHYAAIDSNQYWNLYRKIKPLPAQADR